MVLLERFPQKLKYFHLLGKSSHGMHRLPTNSRDNAQQAATPPTGAPRVNRIQCEKFSTSRYLAKIGVFTGKNHTVNGVFPLDFHNLRVLTDWRQRDFDGSMIGADAIKYDISVNHPEQIGMCRINRYVVDAEIFCCPRRPCRCIPMECTAVRARKNRQEST